MIVLRTLCLRSTGALENLIPLESVLNPRRIQTSLLLARISGAGRDGGSGKKQRNGR